MEKSLQKSGQNQVQVSKTRCRTSLQTMSEDERKLLQTVKTIEDGLAIHSELASITSLKLENQALCDAFIGSNFLYIADILGMELSKAQQNDLLDEVGQVGWLTMADFKLVLDRMKKHKFFRRDYQELLVEFWKYADERLERAFEVESAKVDKTDTLPRTGEAQHIKDLNVFKINQERNNEPI